MTTGFFVAASVSVIVEASALTAWMAPARFRKFPLTISAASSVVPSALLGAARAQLIPGLYLVNVLFDCLVELH